jgi:membrane protein DedA with SNARE-associated domain
MAGFWHEALTLIEPAVARYGGLALFTVIFLESFGVPLPGESALIAAGVLAARGDLSIATVVLSGWSGAVLGDTTGYWIGRLGGRTLLLRLGPRIGLTAERLDRFSELFRRRGFPLVVGARFVVLLRQLNGLVAGSVLMPFPRFLLANSIGAGLWATAWGLGPYLLGTSVRL